MGNGDWQRVGSGPQTSPHFLLASPQGGYAAAASIFSPASMTSSIVPL